MEGSVFDAAIIEQECMCLSKEKALFRFYVIRPRICPYPTHIYFYGFRSSLVFHYLPVHI